jgi:hypothetical protein
MIRSKLLIALLAAIPALALASPFSKDYTESMIVPDSISMGEAKLNLINKIRLDAANDAGARLKKVTTLTQVGTVDPDPVSIFSKTVVSLVHVQNEKYSFSTNKFGQVELVAIANVLVDDAELQQADDAERKAKIQQQRIFQLEHENRDLKIQIVQGAKNTVQVEPGLTQQGNSPNLSSSQANPAKPVPFVDELLQQSEKNKGLLSADDRNTNYLTPNQSVRFNQLCERFKAIDRLILNSGVQSSYLGTKDVKTMSHEDGNGLTTINSSMQVTWDWTKEMELIHHLMGGVGTIDGNTYVVLGDQVNDKALLVAIRKCERANRFTIGVSNVDFKAGGDGWGSELFKVFNPSIQDPTGLIYYLVFKGNYPVDISNLMIIHNGDVLNSDRPVSVASIKDDTNKLDTNRLFGTENLVDPNDFGNEESNAANARTLAENRAAVIKAEQEQKRKQKHNNFVSYFGRAFAAGIQGNKYDPDKCAEYGGILTERPRMVNDNVAIRQNGFYYSCELPQN